VEKAGNRGNLQVAGIRMGFGACESKIAWKLRKILLKISVTVVI
jgi:hypothetical protein